MPDFAVAAAVVLSSLGICGTIWTLAHGGEAAFSGTARIYRREDELVREVKQMRTELSQFRKSSKT
jgi:hypothetical protein